MATVLGGGQGLTDDWGGLAHKRPCVAQGRGGLGRLLDAEGLLGPFTCFSNAGFQTLATAGQAPAPVAVQGLACMCSVVEGK